MAPDLYGGTVATTIEEVEAIGSDLEGTRAVEDVTAAVAYLHEHPHRSGGLGLVGLSMGAFYGLEVIRTWSTDVDVAVLFYGTCGGDYADVTTAVLGHLVEDDRFETPDDVESLRDRLAAGEGSSTFHTHPGTEHWVFEPDRPEYDEEAAGLAWSRTIEFLRAELRTTGGTCALNPSPGTCRDESSPPPDWWAGSTFSGGIRRDHVVSTLGVNRLLNLSVIWHRIVLGGTIRG